MRSILDRGGPSGPSVVVCQKGGGVFTLCVLDVGGASDRHVVLLTERQCCFCEKGYSSIETTCIFSERGASDRDVEF